MVVDTKLYDILQVSPSATTLEIKKAFKKLALIHHPDKNGGNDTKFKEIDAAYKVLLDEKSRNYYDTTGKLNSDIDILQDVFKSFNPFAHHFQQQQQRVTPDRVIYVEEDLLSFYQGIKKRDIVTSRQVICKSCTGSGGNIVDKCQKCLGNGIINIQQRAGMMIFQQQAICPNCQGTGKFIKDENKCKQCTNGPCPGYILEQKNISVELPAGSKNMFQVIVPESSDEKVGHKIGNVIVIFKEKSESSTHENKVFTRDGERSSSSKFKRNSPDIDNLSITIDIPLCTALVGGNIEFAHLNKEILTITIPKGQVISPNQILSIPGKGMPVREGSDNFGNLNVTFNVIFPSHEWSKRVNENAVKTILEA
jgi:DnaJ family protein A protein 2